MQAPNVFTAETKVMFVKEKEREATLYQKERGSN